ncbi:alpha/beta fold hydrolase [Caldimonas taiwanensis]|uniref:alpha/beta fold hydrolase n=1 Tax=Caldimonas taiwanensis TaxID=307483 RepID=UPI000781A447|nr:alpha/beta fold hydrolase [Caldimonas taiwanensis]
MSVETFDIDLPHGIRLACRAQGPREAPVLVLLHGFPEAAFVWDEVGALLAGRFRCVAPNLRGYPGSSSPPEVEAYRAKHLVRDIVALIDALGAPVAAVVAHDWGGAVAWNLAAQQPESIERLVIVNSPHPAVFLRELLHNPEQQRASAYMNFLCRPDAQDLLADNDFARLWPFFTSMGAGADGHGWLTEAVKDQYRAAWRHGLDGPLNYYRASPLRPPLGPSDPIHSLRFDDAQVRVQRPTLVIWGEGDMALPPSLLDGLERWVPRLELLRVPGATHWIVHEQPGLVAEAIAGFVPA